MSMHIVERLGNLDLVHACNRCADHVTLAFGTCFGGKSGMRGPNLGSECQPNNHICPDGEIRKSPWIRVVERGGWRAGKQNHTKRD